MSISQDIKDCSLCPLSAKLDSGFKPIPGEGTKLAKILLVYDNLSKSDYLTQQNATSNEGIFLDKILAKTGLSRKEMYITSLLKCYCDKPSTVKTAQYKLCGGWLDKQIDSLKPHLILACGIGSIAHLLGRSKANIKLNDYITKTQTNGSTMMIFLPALFSLMNAGKATTDYHVDRIKKGQEWVTSLSQISTGEAAKN